MASLPVTPLEDAYEDLYNSFRLGGEDITTTILRALLYREDPDHGSPDTDPPLKRVFRIGDRGTNVMVVDLDQECILSTMYSPQPAASWIPREIISLQKILNTRHHTVHGRIVFISTVSGVGDREQARRKGTNTVVALGIDEPPGNIRMNVDIAALNTIAGCTLPDPDLLLRYLSDSLYLTDRACLWRTPVLNCTKEVSSWREFQVCVDDENHFFVAFNQKSNSSPWTMLILAKENNCMGFNFHKDATAKDQPLQAFDTNPTATFQALLLRISLEDRIKIKANPMFLVNLYSLPFVSAFAAHIELYHRNWFQSYEPWARSSTVYGYAHHREVVRRLSRTYATQLRCLEHTVDGLENSLAKHDNTVQQNLLAPLLRDFKRFSRQTKLLKQDCDQFLEQQISKLALQDARSQIQEAKDIKRLSYFAFFFVPLSLASSFFGMNVKELDSGSNSVWVFIVVALGLLGISILTWFSTSRWDAWTAFSYNKPDKTSGETVQMGEIGGAGDMIADELTIVSLSNPDHQRSAGVYIPAAPRNY